MTAVPVIETERLILREHREADLDALTAIWGQPEVYRYTYRRQATREEVWRAILMHRGMWTMFGFGFFAVEEKSSGIVLGEVGVQERKRPVEPPIEGTLEAGWILSTDVHGKGYAREAMQAVLDWCATAQTDRKITCMIDPENTASRRLAERLGFREPARSPYNGLTTVIFQRN